ncbi:unnamed protein product [Pelagomonas calceolata]|uniref:Uncharacterized protein n=1 Tax=Pelagomonas calceolata TaxID=35677 RepID=A0A8J2SE09_9STRA|nr:unnamed protein product [Pelagomonas calceolata]
MVLPDKIRVAARAGYVDIVSKWLDADAAHDVNDVAAAADDPRVRGCGLLFSALQYPMPGHDGESAEAMVSYLVARGADVRHRPRGTGPTPLHMACSRALTGAVRDLVRAGADVNAPFLLSPLSTPSVHDFLIPPLSMLFNDFLLELAHGDSDDRTTGEVQEDMYACMLELLRAGAAIDFFHLAEGAGDPTARGLEDAIMELMRSEYAGEDAEDAPRLSHICPPGVEPGQRFLIEDSDGEVYAVEVPTGIRPGMPFQAHPKTLDSLNECLEVARAVRASMYPSASSRLTPWRQYLLAPRLELLRLRSLVGGNRATSRLKRLPSTAASSDRTPARAGGPTAAATGAPTRCSPWTGRKFDCTTRAGVLDALAQTKPEPAPTGRIIPPPRQSYKQRPLSVAAMRHIEWLMAPQTPRELVWRVLQYWNPLA